MKAVRIVPATILFLCVVLANAAVADDAKAGFDLTLHDAIELALAQHPSVERAHAVSDRARAGVTRARAAWLPSLNIGGTLQQFEEPMGAWPIHQFAFNAVPPFDETLIQGTIQLEYTLFDGSRPGRMRQARRQSEAAVEATTAAEQQLMEAVVGAYLSVLSAEELVRSHDRRYDALTSELDRVRQLHAVGRAADVEIARAEAALASADADRVGAQGQLDIARYDLARLVDQPADIMMSTQLYSVALAAGADVDLPMDVTAAVAHNREYLAKSSEVQAAAGSRAAARNARWPQVTLRGTVTEFRDGDGHHTNEWNALATIGLPIFTGGVIASQVAEADAAHRIASEELRLTEDRIAAEIDRATTQVRESHARVQSLTRAVASLEEVVRIEKLRLDTGSQTQTDYLKAEADLLAARAGLINARHAEMSAHTTLARVTGVLSPEWIDQTLEHK